MEIFRQAKTEKQRRTEKHLQDYRHYVDQDPKFTREYMKRFLAMSQLFFRSHPLPKCR